MLNQQICWLRRLSRVLNEVHICWFMMTARSVHTHWNEFIKILFFSSICVDAVVRLCYDAYSHEMLWLLWLWWVKIWMVWGNGAEPRLLALTPSDSSRILAIRICSGWTHKPSRRRHRRLRPSAAYKMSMWHVFLWCVSVCVFMCVGECVLMRYYLPSKCKTVEKNPLSHAPFHLTATSTRVVCCFMVKSFGCSHPCVSPKNNPQ